MGSIVGLDIRFGTRLRWASTPTPPIFGPADFCDFDFVYCLVAEMLSRQRARALLARLSIATFTPAILARPNQVRKQFSSRPHRHPRRRRRPSLFDRLPLRRHRPFDLPQQIRIAEGLRVLPCQLLDLLDDAFDDVLARRAKSRAADEGFRLAASQCTSSTATPISPSRLRTNRRKSWMIFSSLLGSERAGRSVTPPRSNS